MDQSAFRLPYIFSCALAVLITFFLHELSHWVMGEWLGNDMSMTLNEAFPVSGKYSASWQEFYVSLAGPLFTISQAILVFFLMRTRDREFLFPFLMTPLVMRVLATLMNFINPNDEGRIGLALGIGLLTVPIVVCLFLFFLTRSISRRRHFDFGFNANTVVLVVVFSSILILADKYF